MVPKDELEVAKAANPSPGLGLCFVAVSKSKVSEEIETYELCGRCSRARK